MKVSKNLSLKMRFALGLSLAIFALSFMSSCNTNKSMGIQFGKKSSKFESPYSLKEKKNRHEEEEEREKADWSEERDRFDYDMLKDPTTGRIPRNAAVIAAEAAQRAEVFKARSIDGRSMPITIVPRGPNNLGGRTRAIGIDVRNANIMLAGSVSSGVFRSTNGGASWTRVAPIGQIHNVTAIAQDPRPGFQDTWYYGGGEGIGNSASLGSAYRGFGIWKSTDNGLTWASLANTQSVLESFDSPFDYVYRIVVNPVNGNIYAAAANTIQRSTDGGSTWNLVLGSFVNTNYTDIIVTPAGRLYAAFDGRDASAGVWTSTTGASGSWTKIGIPGTTLGWQAAGTYGRTVLTYAPSNPNIVFALYWNGLTSSCTTPTVEAGFFKWDNSTTTWTNLTANLPNEPGCLAGNDPFAVQTGYDLVVAVKPDDVNTVFVGGTNVYRSTSGFTNTTATTRIGGYNSPANYALYPNHHPDIHALVFATGDNNTLYTGDDGGIHKGDITVPTVVWTSLNNNYVTYQYYHADIDPLNGSSVIMGGAQDNGTTANPGGGAFSSIFGGDGTQTNIISYTSPSNFNVIAASQSGNLVRLVDVSTGFSIRPLGSTSIFVTYFNLDQDNTNLLYYAGNTALFRTRNARGITSGTVNSNPAINWERMTGAGLTGDIRSMATSRNEAHANAAYTATDANRKLYIGTSLGRVYRLNNPAFVAATTAAVNITPPTANLSAIVSSIAINPYDDNEIMVTYSNYGVVSVFHTFNANTATPTWTEVEGSASGPVNLGSTRSCIIARIGTTTTYLVGNSTGLYTTQTLNGASTVWEQVGTNDINYAICASMRLRVSDNRIVLGTHGNGMFELQLPPAEAPSVTVNTSPTGLNFSVDGTTYSSPQTFNWASNSTHTIATTSPQSLVAGTQYVFNNWSDAGAISHTVTATANSATYTANFNTQYLLTTTSQACGAISPATGYYNPGNIVVTATPNAGYTFTGFTGALTGTTNPQTLNLTGPATVNANFSLNASIASVSQVTCNGGNNGSVTLTAPSGTGVITYTISPNVGTQSPIGTFNGLTAQAYTFTATDANGCSKTLTTTITQPPAITITPTVTHARCFGNSGGTIAIVVSGGTGTINYTISANANTKSTTSPFAGLLAGTYTFTATDANGCVKTQTATVTEPSPVVIATAVITNATCFSSTDGKIVTSASGGTGAISLGIYPNNGTQSPAGTFTGLSPIAYMVIATDANNCEATKFAVVSSGNCNSTIYALSGTAVTEDNTEVNNVTVSANTNSSVVGINEVVNGAFNMAIAPSVNVQVRAVKSNNDDAKLGVNTFDIFKMSQHALDIEHLSSPYKLIAADVDKSGEIDAVDILLMRRFILKMIPNLPGGNFRFIDKAYTFINPANPFAENFPEVVNIASINANTTANFLAVKLGDVNNSYNATTTRSARTLTFNAEDIEVVAGNEYTVNIFADKLDVAAFQGTFSFNDATVKSVIGGNLNNMSNGNFGIFSNAVTTSWNGKAQEDVDVMTITFVANKSGKLSDMLTVNSALTQAVANDAAGNEITINLKYNTGKVAGGEFVLYQNQPNPVENKTTIGFNLPKEAQANLTILTVDGKVVKVITGQYKAGYNTIAVDKSDLKTSGVFYYRLETANHRATKKMIIIE